MTIEKNKISLGLCTFSRPDYAKQCLNKLIENNFGGANKVYLIEDCSPEKYSAEYEKVFILARANGVEVIQNKENLGVGKSKNILLRKMMADETCNHLFLMEDDILMKNPTTCIQYIQCAQIYNVEHMNFALHGGMNVGKRSYYKGTVVYPECIGAFSYYTRNVIEKVGLIDEEFINAWEHVELTYRIAEAGLTTPFWYFADHPLSEQYLIEIEGSINHSSIRPLSNWQSNIKKGQQHWVKKHNKWLPTKPAWV